MPIPLNPWKHPYFPSYGQPCRTVVFSTFPQSAFCEAKPGTALVFSGAIWVIPAVTHIFSIERDGVLGPPPLQPSSLLVPHENMQKPSLCLLTLLCLIIQTREEEKKEEATCNCYRARINRAKKHGTGWRVQEYWAVFWLARLISEAVCGQKGETSSFWSVRGNKCCRDPWIDGSGAAQEWRFALEQTDC